MADVSLVCGSSGALGAAVVEALSARGDTVVALDHAHLDLTDPDAVEALWEELAGKGELPRWVVNTVGGFRGGKLAAMEADDVRALLSLNLETALWSSRAAARRLGAGGAIVNVSARAALSGGAGSAAYAVAKAGVVRLTAALALELAEQRVRVNAVLPSLIDTPQSRALPGGGPANAVPPEQIASVIAFLCSDAAAAVTGAAIPVYGWA